MVTVLAPFGVWVNRVTCNQELRSHCSLNSWLTSIHPSGVRRSRNSPANVHALCGVALNPWICAHASNRMLKACEDELCYK